MKKHLLKLVSFVTAMFIGISVCPLGGSAAESGKYETESRNEIQASDSNALGGVVAAAMNETAEQREQNNGYGIYDASVSGQSVMVHFSAPDNTTLVAAIFEEDSMQMVASGKAPVNSGMNETVVELSDYVEPMYYVMKVFLLDNHYAPVCANYENRDHTRAMEKFFAKDITDFDEEKVINFDYSSTDNFAVVTDDAVTVAQTQGVNILATNDYENGIYVFENADSSITSLKPGNILYFEYGDSLDDYILIKVGKITNKNGTVTITSSDDYEISDFFSYIDLDTACLTDSPVAPLYFDDDKGDENADKQFNENSGQKSYKAEGKYSINVNLSAAITPHVEFKYDFKLFGKDYYEFAYWIDVNAQASAKLDFFGSFETTQTLLDVTLPVISGLDIQFELKMTFKAQASFSAEGSITFTMKEGAKKTSTTEQQSISEKPKLEYKVDVNGNFKLDLIPEISVGFKIIKVFSVTFDASFDFTVQGDLIVPALSEKEKKHLCTECIDGNITLRININFVVKFIKKEIIKPDLFDKTITLGDFYCSLYANELHFGWGECPNYEGNPNPDDWCGEGGTDPGESTNPGEGEENESDYTYQVNSNGTATITKYIGSGGAVRIPRLLGGHIVTGITYDAFKDCTGLTSVTIPDSVTWIAYAAFAGCTGLTSIVVDANNPNYSSKDGVLFNKDQTELIIYPRGKSGSYTIPNSVTTIGGCAFSGCTGLTSITIPDSVTEIQEEAFDNTGYYNDPTNWENGVLYIDHHLIKANADKLLTTCSVRQGTKTIADFAFFDCTGLTSVNIPDSVTSIGDKAFEYCTGLTFVNIPDSVTTIGQAAFYGTGYYNDPVNWETGVLYIDNHLIVANVDELPAVYSIRPGTKTIEDYAFNGCKWLTSITIPGSVTTIGAGAFSFCTGLTSVDIPDSVTLIDQQAFACCTGLKSIKIPDSMAKIGDWVFQDCTGLTSADIPSSVDMIGSGAFHGCTRLADVYYAGSQADWGKIEIESPNDRLIGANIHYSSPNRSNAIVLQSGRSISPYRVDTDAQLIVMATVQPKNETLTGAVKGSSYIILIVRDKNAEDLLAPDNLLYIDQKTAESEVLIFDFTLADGITDYDVIFGGDNLPDTPALPGDIDGDGKVSVTDALAILRMAVGLSTPTDNADLDGMNGVTVTDALAALRIAVGLA